MFHKTSRCHISQLFAGIALFSTFAISNFTMAAPSISLGALMPLTGPNAVYGELFSEGINAAADIVNNENFFETKVKIVYVDSKALSDASVIGMNKLTHVDKVPVVLTAFSRVSKAIQPIGERTHTIMINGGGVSADLALGGYFINDIPLVNQEMRALLPYLVEKHNSKRVALLYMNDVFGQSIDKEIREECKKLGCTVVADLGVDPNAGSFQSEVIKIRNANPDTVFIGAAGQQTSIMSKQLRDGGVKAQFVGASAYGIPPNFKLPESQGAIFINEHVDYQANALTKKFVAQYEKKHNKQPDFYSINYANGVFLAAALADRLQKAGKPITGENMLKALKENRKVDLLGGELSFSEEGTVTFPMEVRTIRNGAPVTIDVIKP